MLTRAWAPARASLVALALALGGLVPVAAPSVACASDSERAALVVDAGTEGATTRYCVTLPGESVSGIELIRLAGEQHGLDYELGYGGGAVCMLAGVGPTGADCFEDFPDFWGYWTGDASGGWTWSGSGAATTTVSDGDVNGWSWGSGSDGAGHRAPPSTTFSSLCGAEEPAPTPEAQQSQEPQEPRDDAAGSGGGDGGDRDGGDGGGSRDVPDAPAAPPSDRGDDGASSAGARPPPKPKGSNKPRRDKAGALRAPHPQRSPAGAAAETSRAAADAAAPPPAGGDGPPAAGIAGIGATIALGGAGVVMLRRRRQPL
ncbi:hypothetical protein BH24ACT26_BH24ACT26_01620 [soil metagenome]